MKNPLTWMRGPNLKSRSGPPQLGKTKKKHGMPSSFSILIVIIFIMIFITWILYWAGITTTQQIGTGPSATDQIVDIKPLGVLDSFYAILASFGNKASLILFILLIGAYVNVMFKTKSLEAGIGSLIKKMKGKEILLIPIIMVLFALGGTSFGMAEETIPFYLILIPVFIAAGFDGMTGFLTIMLGAGIGTVGSILNPFKIPIAVDATNEAIGSEVLTTSTGIVFRVIGFILLVSLTVSFVTFYAYRVKKNKKRSVVYAIRDTWSGFSLEATPPMTKKRKASMIIFISSFVILILCLLAWSEFGVNWFNQAQTWLENNIPYFETQFSAIGKFGYLDMSMIFLLSTILIYLINRKDLKQNDGGFYKIFFAGAADLLSVGGIIVVASAIQYVMEKSNLQLLVVNGLNDGLGGLNPTLFIFVTYILFVLISILIPSSSGFAAAIFPIFGPTAVAAGMGSGAITAFTYSSGLINIVSPTSGIFSAASQVSKMPYNKYLKCTWPLMLSIMALSLTILLIGSVVGGSLF